jgi:hypothetical protein
MKKGRKKYPKKTSLNLHLSNKKSLDKVKKEKIGHDVKVMGIGPRDDEWKKMLDDFYQPDWLFEVQKLIRQQQKLKALKLFKERSGYGLMASKKAVEGYIEKGNWSGTTFVRPDRLDLAFHNAMGLTVDQAKEKWVNDRDRFMEWYNEHPDVICVTIDSAFNIAREYLEVIKKECNY